MLIYQLQQVPTVDLDEMIEQSLQLVNIICSQSFLSRSSLLWAATVRDRREHDMLRDLFQQMNVPEILKVLELFLQNNAADSKLWERAQNFQMRLFFRTNLVEKWCRLNKLQDQLKRLPFKSFTDLSRVPHEEELLHTKITEVKAELAKHDHQLIYCVMEALRRTLLQTSDAAEREKTMHCLQNFSNVVVSHPMRVIVNFSKILIQCEHFFKKQMQVAVDFDKDVQRLKRWHESITTFFPDSSAAWLEKIRDLGQSASVLRDRLRHMEEENKRELKGIIDKLLIFLGLPEDIQNTLGLSIQEKLLDSQILVLQEAQPRVPQLIVISDDPVFLTTRSCSV